MNSTAVLKMRYQKWLADSFFRASSSGYVDDIKSSKVFNVVRSNQSGLFRARRTVRGAMMASAKLSTIDEPIFSKLV